jgi:hypothetical protein
MRPLAPDTAEEPVVSPARVSAAETSSDEFARSFERAAERVGIVDRSIRIGDSTVRLCFAGTALAEQLGPAFEHLPSQAHAVPELTIHVWDAEVSGAAPPPLPVVDPGSPRGTTVYSAGDGRRVACRPALGQLSAYDRDSAGAWFWCRNAHELPFWERAAPFRQILHWWLPERGALLLHGAAVGYREGGVLLAGAGGSGKSTSALSTLTSELLYAGDDYVAVQLEPEPRILSLYCSGKLEPSHARLLSHLPPPTFAGGSALEEKSVFYVAERFPERMSRGFPLRAIVAPRVVGDEPRLAPLPVVQALAALAPSTLLQLVPAGQEALSAMANLLSRVPAFRLEVGGPTELIPPAIDVLLRELNA